VNSLSPLISEENTKRCRLKSTRNTIILSSKERKSHTHGKLNHVLEDKSIIENYLSLCSVIGFPLINKDISLTSCLNVLSLVHVFNIVKIAILLWVAFLCTFFSCDSFYHTLRC
jgi:hypothetical protein